MLKIYTYPELSRELGIQAPLLMVDRLALDLEEPRATALKMVSMNESVFAGHFPGEPVLPGVLQVAAMAQTARTVLEHHRPSGLRTVLAGLRRVKFRKPVRPGMAMRIKAELQGETPEQRFEFKVTNTVDGETASSGILRLERRDPDETAPWIRDADAAPMPPESQGEFSDAAEIMRHLPHRLPFLLVDGAANLGAGDACYGYKNITGDDALLAAVPEHEFPGYLQIEAGAQLGCAHILKRPGNAGKLGFFMAIDEAEFHRRVIPGDRLDIMMSCEFGGRYGIAEGTFRVGGALAATTRIKFAIVEGTGR